ncbi:MAG: 3'-5' exonuclease [Bacteroidota bacterium]
MNYIIYDLEATCWEGSPPGLVQEIIEIGAIRINEYAEETGSYNRFVRPILNPYLSPFCKDLTSIAQEDVDRAETFNKVIEEFQDWIGLYEEDYFLCSWGSFDRNILITDCKLHRLEYDWVEPHVNLKQRYQRMMRLHRPCGLKNAVKREGMEFEGIHHRGISDAENLARIFKKHFGEWRID